MLSAVALGILQDLAESCRILFFVAEISSNLSFLIVRIVNSILGIEIRKHKIVNFLIRDCHKGKLGIVKFVIRDCRKFLLLGLTIK